VQHERRRRQSREKLREARQEQPLQQALAGAALPMPFAATIATNVRRRSSENPALAKRRTCSAEMQDLVGRIIRTADGFDWVVKSLAAAASLWEYEDDQFADVILGLHTFAELRQRAGNSLKVVASHFLTTKSGQRTVAVSRQPDTPRAPAAVPEPKPASGAPADGAPRIDLLNGARGSAFEFELTIGPEGETVDMQFSFEARLKQVDAEQDTEVSVTTNLTLGSNHDTIPYCSVIRDDRAPALEGEVRHLALVLGVRVIGIDGPTDDDGSERRQQEDEKLIREAYGGLDALKM
jgi:hypothetical protein